MPLVGLTSYYNQGFASGRHTWSGRIILLISAFRHIRLPPPLVPIEPLRHGRPQDSRSRAHIFFLIKRFSLPAFVRYDREPGGLPNALSIWFSIVFLWPNFCIGNGQPERDTGSGPFPNRPSQHHLCKVVSFQWTNTPRHHCTACRVPGIYNGALCWVSVTDPPYRLMNGLSQPDYGGRLNYWRPVGPHQPPDLSSANPAAANFAGDQGCYLGRDRTAATVRWLPFCSEGPA